MIGHEQLPKGSTLGGGGKDEVWCEGAWQLPDVLYWDNPVCTGSEQETVAKVLD